MGKHDKDRESLIEIMDQYDKIMQRVAVHRTKPVQRLELAIDGTVYTHLTEEEFLKEFTQWLEKEQQVSKFIGNVKEKMKTSSGNLP